MKAKAACLTPSHQPEWSASCLDPFASKLVRRSLISAGGTRERIDSSPLHQQHSFIRWAMAMALWLIERGATAPVSTTQSPATRRCPSPASGVTKTNTQAMTTTMTKWTMWSWLHNDHRGQASHDQKIKKVAGQDGLATRSSPNPDILASHQAPASPGSAYGGNPEFARTCPSQVKQQGWPTGLIANDVVQPGHR